MLKVDVEAVRDTIRDVATKIVLPRFRHLQAEDIAFKVGDDPVTIADQESEAELTRRLKELLPGSKVLGEEAFFADHSLLSLFEGDDPVWIIDPIDGTRNFVDGKPTFAVIVSLTLQNETIAGWIYDPLSGECLIAEKGAGAYLKKKKLQVLEADFLDRMTGAGYEIESYYTNARNRRLSATLSGPKLDPTLLSLAHEYARLVIGAPSFSALGPQWHFHALLTYSTPWDNAAGILIHGEAGGVSAHWNGAPYTPSAYGRGVLLAPDEASWKAIKRWISGFVQLPE